MICFWVMLWAFIFFVVYVVFGKGIVHKIVVVVCRYAGCNMYGNCVENMYVFTI